MDILDAKLDLNFFARSEATQDGVDGKMNIGRRIAQVFNLDIAYAFKVVSAAAANVATLTHSTGQVVQTTGSPVITDGDGKDWEGITLPVATTSLIHLMAIQADPANTGIVTSDGTDKAEHPGAILRAGGLVLLAQPAATAVGAASVVSLTFSAAADKVRVWVFAKSA